MKRAVVVALSALMLGTVPPEKPAAQMKPLEARVDVVAADPHSGWDYTIINNSNTPVYGFSMETPVPVRVVKSPKGWIADKNEKSVWWLTEDPKAMVQPGSSLSGFVILPNEKTSVDSVVTRYGIVGKDGGVRTDYTKAPK